MLVSSLLGVDLESSQLDSVSILGFRDRDYVQVFGKKGHDPFFFESGELRLLTKPSLVNPRWIDYSLPKRWKETCDNSHSGTCASSMTLNPMKGILPIWVVDTWQQCLVRCTLSTPYVALSYVWGGVPSFMTLRENVNQLKVPNSLAEASIGCSLPRTVRDAIHFVQRLRERYLWVDTLCIVQDGEQKMVEINKMAAIYANASVTIIAAEGDDANGGLNGLRGISTQRLARQTVHCLSKHSRIVESFTPKVSWKSPKWYTRAWTFQEALFSRRKLYFERGWVQWECNGAVWTEIGRAPGSLSHYFHKTVPNLDQLNTIITTYNNKELTFPEDSLFAFAGIASGLSNSFDGGFVSGLPASLFSITLLWNPITTITRRTPVRHGGPVCLPSWSWAGWQGSIHWGHLVSDYVKKCDKRGVGVRLERINPLVQWSWHDTQSSLTHPIEESWVKHQKLFWNNCQVSCPTGWARHTISHVSTIPPWQISNQPEPGANPLCFYKHDSEPEAEFWYPLSLPVTGPQSQKLASLISCRTRRAWLVAGEEFTPACRRRGVEISVRDRTGNWAGALQLHGQVSSELCQPDLALELVEIAVGHMRNDAGEANWGQVLDEWDLEERPKGGILYEYYYVLWVEWKDGVAYRKGLGRVEKNAWEAQERGWINLVLG